MKTPPINHPTERADVPTSGPSITSWFSENEAELLYVEQYVPTAGDNIHIYWSGCNFYFGERGGYAGIQHQNDNLVGARFLLTTISVRSGTSPPIRLKPRSAWIMGLKACIQGISAARGLACTPLTRCHGAWISGTPS